MKTLIVANTILQQIGGNKFITMTGAKNLVGSEFGLSMRIGKNAKGISGWKITLMFDDTYTVEFFKIRKLEVKIVSKYDEVYFDQLTHLFETETGLYTRLF